MRMEATSVSVPRAPMVTPTLLAVSAPRLVWSAPVTLTALVFWLVRPQPASTLVTSSLAETTPSVFLRTTQPGVGARLATGRTRMENVPPCVTTSSAASMPSVSSDLRAPPVPVAREHLAIPSLEAAVCQRHARLPILVPSLWPASVVSAERDVTPAPVVSMQPVTPTPTSASAERDLWVMATSSVCLPSCLQCAPPAVAPTATVSTTSPTAVSVIRALEAIPMKAAAPQQMLV